METRASDSVVRRSCGINTREEAICPILHQSRNQIRSIEHLDIASQDEQGSHLVLTHQRNMSRLLHWSLVSFKMEAYDARLNGR